MGPWGARIRLKREVGGPDGTGGQEKFWLEPPEIQLPSEPNPGPPSPHLSLLRHHLSLLRPNQDRRTDVHALVLSPLCSFGTYLFVSPA